MKTTNVKKISAKLFLAPLLCLLGGCAGGGYYDCGEMYAPSDAQYQEVMVDTNDYETIKENAFVDTAINNKSSFSLCSSTAAYTNIRNMILENGYLPNKNAVNIEQMLNYFTYSYSLNEGETLGIFNEVSDCPWNSNHKLASIAVKAKDTETVGGSMNVVFLIDVSGSMYDRLPLVQKSFNYLINNLSDNDRVSIVTYANGVNTLLDGASGKDRAKIKNKVDSLTAGGGTNGSGGIQRAYELAIKHFIEGGNNRVILATDGDFNIGISNQKDLEDFISSKRESGVYLSVLGYGMGNYHDSTAETLARHGNGNAFYIDNESEARKMFAQGLSTAFEVVAKDTKTLITFDKEQVASYRLLGYENALLTEEQFNDEKVDAGEVLSGDVTVAMYEIVLAEGANLDGDLFTSEIHYKDPKTNENKEVKNTNSALSSARSNDFNFQSMIVEYALLLRNSKYKGTASYEQILEMYNSNKSYFNDNEERATFIRLVEETKRLYQQHYYDE